MGYRILRQDGVQNMRIVIFSNPDSVVSYPFEGEDAFGATVREGTDIVGEYFGNATPAQLPDYGGTWPIPEVVVVTYITEFKMDLWRDEVITSSEWEQLIDSNEQAIKKYLKQISGRNGDMSVSDTTYINCIQAGFNGMIFNALRRDELLSGIPSDA